MKQLIFGWLMLLLAGLGLLAMVVWWMVCLLAGATLKFCGAAAGFLSGIILFLHRIAA